MQWNGTRKARKSTNKRLVHPISESQSRQFKVKNAQKGYKEGKCFTHKTTHCSIPDGDEIMKTDKTLPELIKEQIKLEQETAKRLSMLEGRVDSIAAKLLVREMQLDTKKHAEILEASLQAIGGPKSLWDYTLNIQADKKAVKKELEEHIKTEEKMMRQIAEESEKTDDEAIKLLLKHFQEDEKKHHTNIQAILARTYKMEI